MSLDDFFFIKDNHISKADNIIDSIDQVRMFYPKKKITVEVDKISQLKKILDQKIDVVLLDNMNVSQIKKCLKQLQLNLLFLKQKKYFLKKSL